MKIVTIIIEDIERHKEGCICGLCHKETNNSIGAGIYFVPIELADEIKLYNSNKNNKDWSEHFKDQLCDLELFKRAYGYDLDNSYNNALECCNGNGFITLIEYLE